jgi:hypothetical protein
MNWFKEHKYLTIGMSLLCIIVISILIYIFFIKRNNSTENFEEIDKDAVLTPRSKELVIESVKKIDEKIDTLKNENINEEQKKENIDNIELQKNKINAIIETKKTEKELNEAVSNDDKSKIDEKTLELHRNTVKLDSFIKADLAMDLAEKNPNASEQYKEFANKELAKANLIEKANDIVDKINKINDTNDQAEVNKLIDLAKDKVNKANIILNAEELNKNSNNADNADNKNIQKENAKVDLILKSEILENKAKEQIANTNSIDSKLLNDLNVAKTKSDIIVKADVLKEQAEDALSNKIDIENKEKLIKKANNELLKSNIILENEIHDKNDEKSLELNKKATIIVKAAMLKNKDNENNGSDNDSDMDGINIELHKNVVEFDKQIKFLEKLIINQEKLKQEMAMGNTTFVNEINEKINNFEKHINEIFDKLINQYIKNESKPEIKSEIKPEIKPDIYVKSQDSKTIDLNSSAYNFYNYDKNSKKDYNLI